jgi:hypothetical protein
MNNQDNKLAVSVLSTLIAGIALIYTLIMYHDIIFAVAGVSVLFLITAYILTQNVISFITRRNTSLNMQLRKCIDDISTQLEVINSSQSQIGKATYLYTRQAAKAVSTLENNYSESQEALYRNLTSLSSAQNKATKLMIKYDQNNTMKLISTIKDLRQHISDTMVQGFDQIQPNNDEVVAALQAIVDYLKTQSKLMDQSMGLQLNNVAHELQNISSSIQRVQVPVANVMPIPPTTATTVMPNSNPVEEVATEEVVDVAEEIPEDISVEETTPVTEEIPEDISVEETTPVAEEIPEELSVEEATPVAEEIPGDILVEEATPVTEEIPEELSVEEATPVAEEIPEDISVEETSPVVEETPVGETAAVDTLPDITDETTTNTILDEATPEEEHTADTEEAEAFTPTFTVVGKSDEPAVPAEEPAPEPVSVAPVSDDPNKQLSADEIAALFAAAEPAPKKEQPAPEPTPEPVSVTPVSDDPNKQLSPDEIAALFAQMN